MLTAIGLALLVEEHNLDYDDYVVRHWPAFASNGSFEKAKLKVCDIMRHEAGMYKMKKHYNLDECFTPDAIKVNR